MNDIEDALFSTSEKGLVTIKTGDSSGDDRANISDKVISKLIFHPIVSN